MSTIFISYRRDDSAPYAASSVPGGARLRDAMTRSTDAFGDGRAAQRILAALWSAGPPS